jgi:UDP-N-acetylmuramate--alanine ligase
LSIITSLDYDHPDTYPTENEYLEAFSQFADNSKQLITWADQHSELFEDKKNVSIIKTNEINNDIKVTGDHNRKNATLVQMALNKLGFEDNKKIEKILAKFPGTDRRFEKLADNLYSDYGHHPVEIAATLQLARELSDDVVLVYQPHQNIRQHEIRNQYINQFELADAIYWLPTYLSREDPKLKVLNPDELIQNITNKDKIIVSEFDDKLWNAILDARKQNKLVLCMGAGRIDSWVRDRLKKSI